MTVPMEAVAESGKGRWTPVGMSRLNLTRETKPSVANGDRENRMVAVPVDAQSAENDDRTTHTYKGRCEGDGKGQ